MGFSACPICTEDLTDDIVTTKCGHIFHDICVSQWLKNNRACPTCRSHASKRDLIKLFLNNNEDSFRMSQIPTGEVNHEALVKCQKLTEKLNKRIDDLNDLVTNLRSVNEEKEKENETLLKSKCSLEKELKNTRHNCSNLRTKMKYMAEDAEKTKKLHEKAKLLEREVKTMRGLKVRSSLRNYAVLSPFSSFFELWIFRSFAHYCVVNSELHIVWCEQVVYTKI